MFRKSLMAAVLGCALVAGASAAEVFVRIGPPRPVVERRVVAPGPGYVWTPGYYRWEGSRHAWVSGAWVLPPRRHAHWVAHRWVHRPGGWVLVEGHWR